MRPSPEFVADRVLRELQVSSVEDLHALDELAWRRRALVRYDKLDGSEARLSTLGERAVITVSTTVQNQHRRRFSVAHELGHLEMHRPGSLLAVCTGRDLNEWGSQEGEQNLEQEANEFAAAFLMPQAFFEPLCDRERPSLDVIGELAERFRVSLTATGLRYVHFCPDPVALIYSEDGRIEWFKSSASFQELNVYVETKVRLDPRSAASRTMVSSAGWQQPRRVAPDVWFARGKHDAEARIVEHSWSMPSYNAVLTLLWVNEDLYDGDENFLWL